MKGYWEMCRPQKYIVHICAGSARCAARSQLLMNASPIISVIMPPFDCPLANTLWGQGVRWGSRYAEARVVGLDENRAYGDVGGALQCLMHIV